MGIPKLFTIGYQGSTPSDLIDRLREAGVECVVDVRELTIFMTALVGGMFLVTVIAVLAT